MIILSCIDPWSNHLVAHSTTLVLKPLGHYWYHASFFIPLDQLPPPRSHLTLIELHHTFLPISTSRLLQSIICQLHYSHHHHALIVLVTGATHPVLLICPLLSPPCHSPSRAVEQQLINFKMILWVPHKIYLITFKWVGRRGSNTSAHNKSRTYSTSKRKVNSVTQSSHIHKLCLQCECQAHETSMKDKNIETL